MYGDASTQKKRIIYILSPRHNTYSRIDLFLLDQWTLQKVSSSSILPATWLDHSPICITIEDNPKTSPTFLWKINTSILQSKLFSEWKIRKKYHANLIKTIINKKLQLKFVRYTQNNEYKWKRKSCANILKFNSEWIPMVNEKQSRYHWKINIYNPQ